MRLEVECEDCHGGWITCEHGACANVDGSVCDMRRVCDQEMYPCPTCKNGYRPMTPQEIREWEDEHQTGWEELVKYEATYKGQRVRVAR